MIFFLFYNLEYVKIRTIYFLCTKHKNSGQNSFRSDKKNHRYGNLGPSLFATTNRRHSRDQPRILVLSRAPRTAPPVISATVHKEVYGRQSSCGKNRAHTGHRSERPLIIGNVEICEAKSLTPD